MHGATKYKVIMQHRNRLFKFVQAPQKYGSAAFCQLSFTYNIMPECSRTTERRHDYPIENCVFDTYASLNILYVTDRGRV